MKASQLPYKCTGAAAGGGGGARIVKVRRYGTISTYLNIKLTVRVSTNTIITLSKTFAYFK